MKNLEPHQDCNNNQLREGICGGMSMDYMAQQADNQIQGAICENERLRVELDDANSKIKELEEKYPEWMKRIKRERREERELCEAEIKHFQGLVDCLIETCPESRSIIYSFANEKIKSMGQP